MKATAPTDEEIGRSDAEPWIFLLDTSVLIDALRSANARTRATGKIAERGPPFCHDRAEYCRNIHGNSSRRRVRAPAFLDNFLNVMSSTANTGLSQAGLLKNEMGARKASTISLSDAIVAAIAIEKECSLMTDNRKDFPMPELNLYPLA